MRDQVSDNISEQELVLGCTKFDRKYQEKLYRRFADKMYQVCLNYTSDEDVAADILQDAFIIIFKKIHQFKFDGSLEGWVRRIIVNSALGYLRKIKSEQLKKENFNVYYDEVEGNVLDDIAAKDLIKLVNNLPIGAQMVLKLFAIEGYNHKEISILLNISQGTSKSQLNRARSLLKEAITKQDD